MFKSVRHPVALWKRHRQTLLSDFLAGATGAVAGAPQAMGFAIIAGISPVYGLYTAVVATIIGALTSSSTFMTIAPTNALALVVGSTLASFQDASQIERLFMLTLLVGLFQFVFGVLRLGGLTRFVSHAVMTGFITGAGLLIILGQLRHLTGYESMLAGGILPRFWDWLTHLGQSDIQTTLIGVVAMIVIWGLHHTRFRSIATLVAIIITTLWVSLMGWDHVALVRDLSPVPASLPGFVMPNIVFAPDLLASAVAIAVLSLVQSTAITRTVPQKDGSTADENRDFVGQGLANIAGAFFQGMPAGGSLSRTAVNVAAGGRTRLANLLAGVFVGLILLSLGAAIEQVTLAALAGHLVIAALGLIRLKDIRVVWRINWTARLSMTITFLSTLVLPLEYSIYVGIILSIALYAYTSASNIHIVRLERTADNHFREIPVPTSLPNHEPVVFSVSGNLYFASIKTLSETLPSPVGAQSPVVILRMRDNEYLGATGLRFLQRYAALLQAQGGKLILAGITPHIYEQLLRTGGLEAFGQENIFPSNELIFGATERALDFASQWLQSKNGTDSSLSPTAS